jgi:hypothetical protein
LKRLSLYFGFVALGFVLQTSFAQNKPAKVKPKTQQMHRSMTVKNTQSASRTPARDPNAPIEVHGQSRNLNMLLILQNPNEEINFVKPRKDYKKEIDQMNY